MYIHRSISKYVLILPPPEQYNFQGDKFALKSSRKVSLTWIEQLELDSPTTQYFTLRDQDSTR